MLKEEEKAAMTERARAVASSWVYSIHNWRGRSVEFMQTQVNRLTGKIMELMISFPVAPSSQLITLEQLKELEWAASSYPNDRRCPVCFVEGPYGGEPQLNEHHDDCWLGKIMVTKKKTAAPSKPKRELTYTVKLRITAASLPGAQKKITEMFPELEASVMRLGDAKSRADRLSAAKDDLEGVISEVESLQDEMEQWQESIPENLQSGDKYQEVEAAHDALEALKQHLEEADFESVDFPGMM